MPKASLCPRSATLVPNATRPILSCSFLGGAKGMTLYAYIQTQIPAQGVDPPTPSEHDAVELVQYLGTPHPPQAPPPAARHAYLGAKLRAAQTLLERGGEGVNVATKVYIHELEKTQSNAGNCKMAVSHPARAHTTQATPSTCAVAIHRSVAFTFAPTFTFSARPFGFAEPNSRGRYQLVSAPIAIRFGNRGGEAKCVRSGWMRMRRIRFLGLAAYATAPGVNWKVISICHMFCVKVAAFVAICWLSRRVDGTGPHFHSEVPDSEGTEA
ncbi:hypothetical protein B0H11DRAFT_1935062 [Mycena galericulata]|nr:hypothetical protein B0H11DRAFT_1935062 [Mycena galericulata]